MPFAELQPVPPRISKLEEREGGEFQHAARGWGVSSERRVRGTESVWVEVESEAGGIVGLVNPFAGTARCEGSSGRQKLNGAFFEISTTRGERLRFTPAAED